MPSPAAPGRNSCGMTRELQTAALFLWERGLGSDEIATALGVPESVIWNEFLAARCPPAARRGLRPGLPLG